MNNLFEKFKQTFAPWLYNAMLDPADSSVTLSNAILRHMRSQAQDGEQAVVFMFRTSDTGEYAFVANPDLGGKPAQLCELQYNSLYRCSGFETLAPTVGRILYDYHLPNRARKFRLVPTLVKSLGKYVYVFKKPRNG